MNSAKYIPRLLNVGIRGAVLLSKFLLMFYLAKYLQPGELGLYGIVVATISYGIYPLGFEFYTYSTRKILTINGKKKGELLKAQLYFHSLLYVIFLPFFSLIFLLDFIPWDVVIYFYLLLIFEHFNQELFRLLIAMSRQLSASISLFFRQGLWAIIVVVLIHYDSDYRSLEFVLLGWVLGSSVALLLSLYALKKLSITGWDQPINWWWVKDGLKVALPFFIATIGTNGIMTVDKYLFEFIGGKELLGVYVFYLSLSISFMAFLDAGVFSFMYPRMIRLAKNGEYKALVRTMKNMFFQILVLGAGFLVTFYCFIDYVLVMVDRSIYSDNVNLFYLLFVATAIQALSYIPHYGLYAQSSDKSIVLSGFFSFFVFLILVWLFSFWNFFIAIPIALIFTYTFVLIWKTFAFRSNLKKISTY